MITYLHTYVLYGSAFTIVVSYVSSKSKVGIWGNRADRSTYASDLAQFPKENRQAHKMTLCFTRENEREMNGFIIWDITHISHRHALPSSLYMIPKKKPLPDAVFFFRFVVVPLLTAAVVFVVVVVEDVSLSWLCGCWFTSFLIWPDDG